MYIRIKEAREKNGIKQQQLADMLGISFATLSGYECGKHDPKSDTLVRIAQICGVTVDWLLGYMVQEEKDNKLLDGFHKLNNDGQDAVIDIVDGFAMMPKYKKESSESKKI